jgi:hypothetical protein
MWNNTSHLIYEIGSFSPELFKTGQITLEAFLNDGLLQ